MDTLFHVILSIFLHIIGILTGLWIWYIFPKNVCFIFYIYVLNILINIF